MNAHAPVRDRLGPLVPRLSPLLGKLGSPHDGEVLAAARAIGRQLERHGLTFNDLGRALEGGPVTRVVCEPEQEMAEYCAARTELLGEKEAEFVNNMLRLLRRPGGRPTPKQQAWLIAIFDRLAEGA